MDQFDLLMNHLKSLEEDFKKFYIKNNKAAGTRIRKGMQELKVMSHEIRTKVQDIKNS